jgi:hypothetical protein
VRVRAPKVGHAPGLAAHHRQCSPEPRLHLGPTNRLGTSDSLGVIGSPARQDHDQPRVEVSQVNSLTTIVDEANNGLTLSRDSRTAAKTFHDGGNGTTNPQHHSGRRLNRDEPRGGLSIPGQGRLPARASLTHRNRTYSPDARQDRLHARTS